MAKQIAQGIFAVLTLIHITEANEESIIPDGLGLDCHGTQCDLRFGFCDKVKQACSDDCDIICENKDKCAQTCPGRAVHKFYKSFLKTISKAIETPPNTTKEPTTGTSLPITSSKEDERQTRLLEAILILFMILYVTIVVIAAVLVKQLIRMSDKNAPEETPMLDKVREQSEELISKLQTIADQIPIKISSGLELITNQMNPVKEQIEKVLKLLNDKPSAASGGDTYSYKKKNDDNGQNSVNTETYETAQSKSQ